MVKDLSQGYHKTSQDYRKTIIVCRIVVAKDAMKDVAKDVVKVVAKVVAKDYH